MRYLLLLLAAVLILVPVVATAAAPLPGKYLSLGGSLQPGRATESLPVDLPGGEGQPGNMITAQSYNGALGTQWAITCPQISTAGPVKIYDDVDAEGNGQRIYRTSYVGGILWLSGTGPWANGDASYTSNLSTFTVIATKQYVNGGLDNVVSSINLRGDIVGYEGCFDMAISNAALVGYTPGSPQVLGLFPIFMGPSDCGVTGSHGTYWTVHDITLTLYGASCIVPTEKPSWGTIKTLYR